ncbi:MAG TPA: Na+/H+ antiporter NhaA [Acidimicrobiales bacterium]|nr:Na+/H+ antiporter NhaA [Acidimicrobiales bacterium]
MPGSLVGVCSPTPERRLHNHLDDGLPPSRIPKALREFFETAASGGLALLAATVVALVWVNSPLSDSYHRLWATELSLRLGSFAIEEDLRHWVNDALMAIFFFVVGLEIKRELVAGELRSWRQASLPIVAAIGGMVVPAVLFVAINLGSEGSAGWGIPMATDIAFALGVAALLGKRVPTGLKLFLLTLAIVDDIGAILVIAVFYSSNVEPRALLVAGVLLGAMGILRKLQVYWMPPYVVLGSLVWLAVFESGVHATIAGVVLGLLAPARPLTPAYVAREWAESLSDDPTPAEARQMTTLARTTSSVAERLELALHPFSSFLIVPVFALANAGVVFDAAALGVPGARRVALGVGVGLVVGKLLGVTLGAVAAVRLRVAELPPGVSWRHIMGAAGLAGIGFTVSLFITDLAFVDADLQAASKIGILAASLVASLVGVVFILAARSEQHATRAAD